MQSDYNTITEIQSEILGYLQEHPKATDTAEGIRQWWIFQRMAKYSQRKVQAALQQLAEARLIEVQNFNDGNETFGLTESKKVELYDVDTATKTQKK